MSKLSSIFLRALPGAYIINSGVGKIGMPAEASEGLQQYAATGVPFVKTIPAEKFGTVLGASEVGIGALMLAPFVGNRLAGAGLTAFSAGLLSLYFANPENTQADGVRPTDEGLSLSKDVFMLAIGAALMADGNDKKAKKNKKAKKK